MKFWIIGLFTIFTFSAIAENEEGAFLQEDLIRKEPVLLAMNKEKQENSEAASHSDTNEGFAFRSFQFLQNHSVEVGVELPLNFGIHGSIRVSDTTYVRLGIGQVYEKFLGVFPEIAPKFGYINKNEANLIVDVLKNSLYLDARLGWMPYITDHNGGPYIELGVSSMLFGQGKTDGYTLKNTLKTRAGDDIGANYSVKSNVYNATFHLGYQIPVAKNLRLNVDAGIVKIFHVNAVSSNSVELEQLPKEEYTKLRDFLVEKGWIFPTVSVWVSFMF